MDVKKSYEFISAGGKIIVRRMETPDYEFKTVLTAEGLVEEKCVANAKVFVLRVGDGLQLCVDTDNSLSVSPLCRQYRLEDGRILYYTDKWYWYDVKKGSVALGEYVHNLSFLWLDKTDGSGVLSWFAKGVLQQKSFLNCQELSGYGIKKLPLDLLKITTEEGDFFVSIRKLTLPRDNTPRFTGRKKVCPVRAETEVLFRTESFADKVEFYKFAKMLNQKLLAEGIGRIVSRYADVLCDYVYSESKEDCVVEYTAGLRNSLYAEVKIYANLSKLFKREKGAYDVRCPELPYQRIADEIEFVSYDKERALWVYFGSQMDKLYAESAFFGQGKLYYDVYTYQ